MASNLNGDLTDFNLSAPSESNSVDEQEPLDALLGGLGNAQLDDVARERILRQRMEELSAQEGPSFWDRLKSPEGIATVLGTLGVGFGGGGLEGAAGFAAGGVGQLREGQAAWEASRSAALEQVQERVDDNVERQLKRNQMFSTALQNAPDQFIDPETGELSAPPELLGYFAYGMPIRRDPRSTRILNQRGEAWSAMVERVEEGIESAATVEDASVMIGFLNRLAGGDMISKEENDALARSIGTDGWDSALVGHYMRHGGTSAKDAMLYAAENGLGLTHPEVVRRLDLSTTEDTPSPGDLLNERFIGLMDQVRAWETDPANAQLVSQIREEAQTPEETRRQIAEQALVNAADVAFYEDKLNAAPSNIRTQLQAMYGAEVAEWGLLRSVRSYGQMDELAGMSEEELNKKAAQTALQRIQANQEALLEDNAKNTGQRLNRVTGRLIEEFPGASHAAAARQAQAFYRHAVQQLGPEASQEQIHEAIDAMVAEYIRRQKAQQEQ